MMKGERHMTGVESSPAKVEFPSDAAKGRSEPAMATRMRLPAVVSFGMRELQFSIRSFPYSMSVEVARMTSSAVVSPATTLRAPSSRRVRMPISRAWTRRTEVGTFS
jgi:hypothetical protein